MTAYVIGNGVSRKVVDLTLLKGPTYGCNALYRDFIPDVLVSTDRPISRFIQESGYAKDHCFYTRRVLEDSGAQQLDRKYRNWSSGPNALALAVEDGHTDVVLIGFDFGSVHSRFNNVYADTEFYKKSTDSNTFSGNWIRQITTIVQKFTKVHYTFVGGDDSNKISKILAFNNVDFLDIDQFVDQLNGTTKN